MLIYRNIPRPEAKHHPLIPWMPSVYPTSGSFHVVTTKKLNKQNTFSKLLVEIRIIYSRWEDIILWNLKQLNRNEVDSFSETKNTKELKSFLNLSVIAISNYLCTYLYFGYFNYILIGGRATAVGNLSE